MLIFIHGNVCLSMEWYLPWMGVIYPSWGLPTLAGGTYLDQRVPTFDGGITLDMGYLPWLGVPTLDEVSTLDSGYLPWLGVPTLDKGYLLWTGYTACGTPLAASRGRTFLSTHYEQ